MALLPTRFAPGALLAAAFACIGLQTGLLVCAFLHAQTSIPTHWACLPLFAIALLYVRLIWRDGEHKHPVRCITALPPRLQAVIFGSCLGIGLGTGAIIALVAITAT